MITREEVENIICRNRHKDNDSIATYTDYNAIAEDITTFYAHIVGLRDITSAGQVKKGDVIVCDCKGKEKAYKVKEVLFSGQHREEVIVNIKKNKFFLIENVLKNKSWAKNAMFMPIGRNNER